MRAVSRVTVWVASFVFGIVPNNFSSVDASELTSHTVALVESDCENEHRVLIE